MDFIQIELLSWQVCDEIFILRFPITVFGSEFALDDTEFEYTGRISYRSFLIPDIAISIRA